MGVMSAVHWWEESQMRVLVLGSLLVQFLLLIFTLLRRRAIPGWIRFLMWLAYLGGDAIAIYALATLFNRHKDQGRGGKSTLEVMWAPILLLHLGGHDGITAYNIEDNELWSRHLLTAVSQVTVAIYVFCKSWPRDSDKRLLLASILLFIPGVLKCFTKPWALKRASINSLVSSHAAKRTAKKGKGDEMDPNSLEKYVKQAKAFVAFVQEPNNKGNEAKSERACVENSHRPPQQQGKQGKTMDPLEKYVSNFVVGEQKDERTPVVTKKQRERILRGEVNKLFVDLSSPYAGRRLSVFKYFWVLSCQEKGSGTLAYGYVRRGLASAFLLLYTKLKTAGIVEDSDLQVDDSAPQKNSLPLATLYGDSLKKALLGFCRQWIRLSRMLLPWAAIGLFHHSHREAYNATDAKITYAILCCTAVLELFSSSPMEDFVSSNNAASCLRCHCKICVAHESAVARQYFVSRVEWPEIVAQYSLMKYFTRNKNHGKLMWIASKLGCKDMVDQRWCMEPCFSSLEITELVLQYLKAGWEKKIQDVASYRSFIDNRGHWALEGNEHLSWSIKETFDESVLLWHIATDFCFFSSPFSEHSCASAAKTQSKWSDKQTEVDAPPAQKTRCAACRAIHMSNYMVYLLFVNPEMLLPGTRRNLFTTAYDELKKILKNKKLNPQSCCQKVEEKEIMEETLINTMQDKSNINKVPKTGSKEEFNEGGQPTNEGSQEKFITDAWDLAKGLLKLRDDFGEEKMWEVIQGVWVEMLCFSASRCRGYLHAKALGSGGEFLSYIWLLMFYMGMETFTERLERAREAVLPSHEANNSAAQASWDSVVVAHKGNMTTSSTSWIHSHGTSTISHLHTGASTSNNSDEIQMGNMV